MTAFKILGIILAGLVMIICYLLFDRAEYRRENRNLRASNEALIAMNNANKQPETVVVPDKSLMGAINDALQPMGTVDFNEMFKDYEGEPYVPRKSKA